jgi:hypothetical protein
MKKTKGRKSHETVPLKKGYGKLEKKALCIFFLNLYVENQRLY